MSDPNKSNAMDSLYRRGNDAVKAMLWPRLTRPHMLLTEILLRRKNELYRRIFETGRGASSWDLISTGEDPPSSYDRKLRLWTIALVKALPSQIVRKPVWTESAPLLNPANVTRIQSWADLSTRNNCGELASDLFRDVFQNPYKTYELPTSSRNCIRCGGSGYETSASDPDWRVVNGPSDGACSSCDGHGVTDDGPCPWLTYDNGRVFEAANHIYETEEFNRLPYLADLLDDVIGVVGGGDVVCPNCNGQNVPGLCIGCDGKKTIPHPILEHLRDTTKPHVQGCWAIDQLSGRG